MHVHARKGHDLDNMASFHAWKENLASRAGCRCIQDANLTKPVCDFMFDSLSRGLGISRIPRVPAAAQCAPSAACCGTQTRMCLSCPRQGPALLFVLLLICFACAHVPDACSRSRCEATKQPRSHQATGRGGPNRQSRPSLRTAACERRTHWQDQSTRLTTGHCSTGVSHHFMGSLQVCSSCMGA